MRASVAMVDAASKLEFATVEHARIDVHRLEPLILLPQHIPESPGYERATATRPCSCAASVPPIA